MRDPRFIAAHRGGLLSPGDHRFLTAWAADCASEVLPFFTRHSQDPRPADALQTARAWARGEVKTGIAMRASVAAHAAARAATHPRAIAAARAAGQAVASAHAADHCIGTLYYIHRILNMEGSSETPSLEKLCSRLPEDLRTIVSAALLARSGVFQPAIPRRSNLCERLTPGTSNFS
jgi:hypothetical protein